MMMIYFGLIQKLSMRLEIDKYKLLVTHGIVHAGFRGFLRFVARKKSRCNLIGNYFEIGN
jgi:hypothetical protein